MHRFIAIVALDAAHPAQTVMRERLLSLAGWTTQLELRHVIVRARTAEPSRLGAHRVDNRSCLVGRAFGSCEGGAAPPWGCYVSFEAHSPDHLVVRRDPTGRVECWRWPVPGGELLFSHLADALALGVPPPSINWDYLLYHLTCHFMRGEETGLAGVTELLPGSEVTYARNAATGRFFWDPHLIAERRFASEGEARSAIRAAGEMAAQAYGSLYARIALDLSGGLDSAIVLGLLRQAAGHPDVIGVNYVTPHPEGDERGFARDAAQLHRVQLLERELKLETFQYAADSADRLMRPSSRMMPMGYDRLHSGLLAETGADAFFTGSGGDHLFAASVGAEVAADHLAIRGYRGLMRRAHEVANHSQDTVWNVLARSASLLWNRSHPLRGDLTYLTAGAVAEVNAERFAHPWRLPRKSTPPGKQQQIGSITELYRHYWRYGRADVAEEAHPLFSQPLMEACLRTPTYFFCSGGLPRGLARAAFGDLLPASIRERRSKGANTSHWVRTIASDLPRVRDLLLGGALVKRGWLDRQALDMLLTPAGLAANRRLGPIVTCLTTQLWIDGMTARLQAIAPQPVARA